MTPILLTSKQIVARLRAYGEYHATLRFAPCARCHKWNRLVPLGWSPLYVQPRHEGCGTDYQEGSR